MRLVWIDVCRGLGMILVVIGHNQGVGSAIPGLAQTLYLFHMPLFFFISGLTLRIDGDIFSLIDRITALLLPYFVLSIVMIPVTSTFNPDAGLIEIFLGILYGTGHTIDLVPMWFLPCLAISICISTGILAAANKFFNAAFCKIVVSILAVVCVVVGGMLVHGLKGHYAAGFSWGTIATSGCFWSAEIAVVGAGFMLFGVLVANRFNEKIEHPIWAVVMFATGALLLAVANVSGLRLDLNFRHFTPLIPSAVVTIAGILSTVALARLISMSSMVAKPLVLVGQASLIILWLHDGLQNRGARILFGESLSPGGAFWFLAGVMAVVLPLIVDRYFVRKFSVARLLVYPRVSMLLQVFIKKNSVTASVGGR